MDSLPEHLIGLDQSIAAMTPELIELRRHLHQNPELSREEFATTQLLEKRLNELGFHTQIRAEKTGLIADIAPRDFDPEEHPTVAIRADMDALPIVELTDLGFKSQNTGVMHACGHDLHMTCAMGAATALSAQREQLPGRVRIIYQHAEESSPSGASEMIQFGAMRGVDAIIALHVDPELHVGKIGLKPGPLTASFDRFTFTIKGRGGHGARPHQCIDPIFVATHLAQSLYAITSRRFDAREPIVLSIGEFKAGDFANVIPSTARLSGTVRTVSNERRSHVERMLIQMAEASCALHGASFDLDLYKGAPPIINSPKIIDRFEDVATRLLGEDAIYNIPRPSMGSEDFSNYLAHAPGAMFRLGVATPDEPVFHLHHPRFNAHEDALAHGAKILAMSALELLQDLAIDRESLNNS